MKSISSWCGGFDKRLLRAQEAVQLEVPAVGHAAFEVGMDAGFEGALVVFDAHGTLGRLLPHCSGKG
jgi:hypothetical protein